MTALQSIIKEAKSLKKQYPKRFVKWTDYVKQASAIYASKHKGKSPVGKKKKVGAAKPISKHKDTKSHNVNIRVVSGIKKKKATKKAVKKSTTLTKVKKVLKQDNKRLVHGYNLTSGSVKMGSFYQLNRKKFIDLLEQIEFLEGEKRGVIFDKKNYIAKHGKQYYQKYLREMNAWIKELKTHKTELFKLL